MASYTMHSDGGTFEIAYEMTFNPRDVNAGRTRPINESCAAMLDLLMFARHYTAHRLYDPVVHSLGNRRHPDRTLCDFRVISLDRVVQESVDHVTCLNCLVKAWSEDPVR